MKNFYFQHIHTRNKSARIFNSGRLIVFLLILSQSTFGQALKLPFWDDFSVIKNSSPDSRYWLVSDSSATINNTYATNPPSFGVATFDGRDSKGVPYTLTDPIAYGTGDYLTSKPIDLSGFNPKKDSVVLSFYWQARGLGEQPDDPDSLLVFAKNAKNQWRRIYAVHRDTLVIAALNSMEIDQYKIDSLKLKLKGEVAPKDAAIIQTDSANLVVLTKLFKVDSTNYSNLVVKSVGFTQVLIPLTDSLFFHQNFQFQFVQLGRLSGAFDTWNIDYVYLNRGRALTDNSTPDIAWQGFKSSLLKNYYSMPMSHFLENPTSFLADTLRASINNLKKNATNVLFRFKVLDTLSNTLVTNGRLKNSITLFQNSTGTIGTTLNQLNFSNLPNKTKGIFRVQFTAIQVAPVTNFELGTIDFNTSFYGLNNTRNDSITHFVELSDYYAYDDGTAEAGANTDQNLGSVAVKFKMSKADTLTEVRMYFTPYLKSITGQSIYLQIFKSDPKTGTPGGIIHQQRVIIDSMNVFKHIKLESSIAVAATDTFFVGFRKISNDVMAIGVDKNTNSKDKIYYNSGNEWVKNTSIEGSLMIRPVIGKKTIKAVVTAVEQEKADDLVVYPNPVDGILQWNLPNIKSVIIVDVSGKEVVRKNMQNADNQSISVELLGLGTYFVNLSDGKRSYTKKIIKVK